MSEELIDFNALEEQMNSVNKEIEALKKSHIETSKQVFHKAISAFFQKYPEVEALRWNQYTPYFNDGDTCEFSVHDLYFCTKQDLKEIEDGEITLDDLYDLNPYAKPDKYVYEYAQKENSLQNYYLKQIEQYEALEVKYGPRLNELNAGVKQFKKIFSSISDDTMLSLFGDHVVVTATRRGIDVDEYDHE